MIPDFAGFRAEVDRAIQRACVKHLGWRADDVRQKMRARILEDAEFWVMVFWERRHGKR